VHNDPSGSFKVVDFDTNQQCARDLLLVLNSNLAVFQRYAESHFFCTPPLCRPKFWGIPLEVDVMLGSVEKKAKANKTKLLFSKNSSLNIMDVQMTCHSSSMLCVALHVDNFTTYVSCWLFV